MENKYTALMSGMFNAMSVNKKLRSIWTAIEGVNARLSALEATEAITEDTAFAEITEPEAEAATVDSKEAFDWKTSDDAQALKDYALSEFGKEIKGNKKPDTVRAEIEEFITSKED